VEIIHFRAGARSSGIRQTAHCHVCRLNSEMANAGGKPASWCEYRLKASHDGSREGKKAHGDEDVGWSRTNLQEFACSKICDD